MHAVYAREDELTVGRLVAFALNAQEAAASAAKGEGVAAWKRLQDKVYQQRVMKEVWACYGAFIL